MTTPDQCIYAHIYEVAETALGYTVYPVNPPPDTPYPYIQMGMVQILPKVSKSFLYGQAYAMADVWGGTLDRHLVSAMATSLLEELGRTTRTKEGLELYLDQAGSSIEIMIDNTTSQDLWRARMSLHFHFH